MEIQARAEESRRKARALQRYERYGLRRTLHGFYYISHYHPLRAMKEIDAEEAERVIQAMRGQRFETYIHFPYCEYICTFCHFYKKPMGLRNVSSRQDEALGLVEREMRMYAQVFGGRIPARSLQIGGGTPSLIENARLAQLLRQVAKYFDFEPGAEIKMEIYPQRYPRAELDEKLSIMKDFGFTDIVIDLESGNRQTLDFINRPKSSLDAYQWVVERCVARGFDRIVTALMCGLPHETYQSLDHTLTELTRIDQVRILNTFPVILRETDPISEQLRRRPEAFHDATERDAMWIYARDWLRDRGFVEGPISYLHQPDSRPDQQADKFECVNLLGMGTSAFGYLNGDDWAGQYFNYCNATEYAERIANDRFALWRFGRYGQDERARRKVIFGLANVKTENLREIERRYGVSIDAIYGKVFNALLALGLIELDPAGQGIRYTEDGLCRLEELTYFLSSDHVKDCCDRLPDRNDPHYRELINQHYFTAIPREDRERMEAFIAEQSSDFMYRLEVPETRAIAAVG